MRKAFFRFGADSFENGTWERDLIHEYTHFEEGTDEYEKLGVFLADKSLTVDTKNGKRSLAEVAAETVFRKGYGFTVEEMNDITERKNAKKPLTAAEEAAYSVFNDELVAHSAEYLLGNEAFIDKLVAKDAPLARKVFDKLVDVCKTIGGKGASKTLKTAQKLYIKAAEKSGNTRLAKYILSHAPELEEEESLDSEEKVQYNRKGLYKQIPKKEYAIISSRIMEDNSRYMAHNQELPRYGKARSADYFYVYENFAPGNFGVLKQIKITDANREYIASIEAKIGENNGEQTIGSTSELNRVLEVLKTRTRRNRGNNALDSEGRANSGNGGVSSGESASDGIGHSQKSNGNLRNVKFSRKAQRPDGATYQISDGQVKRLISGLAKGKKYSKADADEAIHEILLNSLYSDDERVMLRGKARKDVVSMILQSLNTEDFTKRDATARKVADYIVEHAVLEGSLEDINVQIEFFSNEKAFRNCEKPFYCFHRYLRSFVLSRMRMSPLPLSRIPS
ncbi:MAG: hypothetical protein E7609_00335 [Ruminococcaceae bacterium]|nr:hypothetical protein [Oscillospiraceae bacterium]